MSPEATQEWKDMLDEMKKDHDKKSGSRFWSPPKDKEGTFPIRILPPLKKLEEKKFYFQHFNHWIDGTSYECLDQTIVDKNGNEHKSEECPVCRFVRKLYKTAERGDDDWKLAGELSRKPRYIYRIVVRGTEDETVPQFYETGKTIFQILYHLITETDYGVIIDPANGRDFNLTKVGLGRRSRYEQSMPAAKTSPIFTEADKLRKLLDLAKEMKFNSLIEFPSAKAMEGALNDFVSGGNKANDEEPVQSTKASPTTNTTKKKTVEPKPETEVSADSKGDDDIESILYEFQ